jgi:hypothetical protein
MSIRNDQFPQGFGKAGGLQILRCQGFEVNYYNWPKAPGFGYRIKN